MNNFVIHLIAYTLLLACNLAFVTLDVIRFMAVRGTRLRYLCATIQWALALPALLCPALIIMGGRYILGPISFLMTLKALYDLYIDDDDNWFRRKRKQLKARLTAMHLRPHLVGAKT